jgi:hypothetical protein
MSYPPAIAFGDFKPATPPSLSTSSKQCDQDHTCSIVGLWLHPHVEHPPFTAEHEALEADDQGRYRFAPGAANTDEVRYRFSNVGGIHSATLSLYSRTAEPSLARFSRVLDLVGGEGSLRLNDLLGVEGHPNVLEAPYLLELSIIPKEDTRATVARAWIYLDVVVKRIALHLATDVTVSAKDRAVLEAIDAAVLADSGKLARVLLPNNSFARTKEEFLGVRDGGSMAWHGTDCAFDRHAAAWGQGPVLPLAAELLVEDSSGKETSSPEGTRGATVLWDVVEAGTEAPDGLDAAPDKAVIQDYLSRYKAYKPTEPGAINCHADFGGKRGSDQRLLHATVPGSGANPGGYPVSIPETRTQAAFSKVLPSGRAGVYFQPSRMAGDAYRLAVHFHYAKAGDGAPQLDRGGDLDSACQVRTGIFQVWKQIDIIDRRALKLQEEVLAGELTALQQARDTYIEDLGDEDLQNAWNELPQDARDGLVEFQYNKIQPGPGQIKLKKAEIEGLRAAWGQELEAIRVRLGRAFVHVNADSKRPASRLDGYHDALLEIARESSIIPLAIADTPRWRTGDHALEFVPYPAFWDGLVAQEVHRRTNSGSVPGEVELKQQAEDAMVSWAQTYFGVDSDAADGQAHLLEGSLMKEGRLDVSKVEGAYKESCRNWAKRLLARAAERVLDGAAGIYVFMFSALYVMDGEQVGPMAYAQPLSGLDGSKLLYVVFERSDETTAAHEIGHGMFLCHAPGGIVANPDPHAHDVNMGNCLMGYDEKATDFCGFCQLRLRGWDRSLLRPNP